MLKNLTKRLNRLQFFKSNEFRTCIPGRHINCESVQYIPNLFLLITSLITLIYIHYNIQQQLNLIVIAGQGEILNTNMVVLDVLMRKTYFMARRPITSTTFVKITLIHVWQAKELELYWVMEHILPETPNIPTCTQEQIKIETSTCFWPKYCVENGIKEIRITGALLILIPRIPTQTFMTPVWIMWIIPKYSAFTTKTSTIQII